MRGGSTRTGRDPRGAVAKKRHIQNETVMNDLSLNLRKLQMVLDGETNIIIRRDSARPCLAGRDQTCSGSGCRPLKI